MVTVTDKLMLMISFASLNVVVIAVINTKSNPPCTANVGIGYFFVALFT